MKWYATWKWEAGGITSVINVNVPPEETEEVEKYNFHELLKAVNEDTRQHASNMKHDSIQYETLHCRERETTKNGCL